MWINIVGAPSSKQKIADTLVSEFSFQNNCPITKDEVKNLSQPDLMRTYFERDKSKYQQGVGSNAVSINNFHFQHLVYARALYELNLLSNEDYDESQRIYNEFQSKIPPPSILIYLTADPVLIINKCKLEENEINESLVELILKYSAQVVEQIRIPVLEMEATAPFDRLWDDVKFEVDQIGTTRLAEQSFWTRTLFKAGSDYFDWE